MSTSPHKPSVVILGGGTGTFVVAQALKNLVHVTAVLTMVDDGGSNKDPQR